MSQKTTIKISEGQKKTFKNIKRKLSSEPKKHSKRLKANCPVNQRNISANKELIVNKTSKELQLKGNNPRGINGKFVTD